MSLFPPVPPGSTKNPRPSNNTAPQDLATAHLLALSTPAASNKRFLIGKSDGQAQAIADILRASFPEQLAERTPRGKPGTNCLPEGRYDIDTSRAREVLGMNYRTLEETVVDGVAQLLEIEARSVGERGER